jgi:hypothetical protein
MAVEKFIKLSIFFLLVISNNAFPNKMEMLLSYYQKNLEEPYTYKIDYQSQTIKVEKRFFEIDSLPNIVKSKLLLLLDNKVGKNWPEVLTYLRADLLVNRDESKTDDPDYMIWFNFQVGKSDYYKLLLYGNPNGEFSTLRYPNVSIDSSKCHIITIYDAWKIALENINGDKIQLIKAKFYYNIMCDELEWQFIYRKKKFNFFQKQKNVYIIQINAHNGKVQLNIKNSEWRPGLK